MTSTSAVGGRGVTRSVSAPTAPGSRSSPSTTRGSGRGRIWWRGWVSCGAEGLAVSAPRSAATGTCWRGGRTRCEAAVQDVDRRAGGRCSGGAGGGAGRGGRRRRPAAGRGGLDRPGTGPGPRRDPQLRPAVAGRTGPGRLAAAGGRGRRRVGGPGRGAGGAGRRRPGPGPAVGRPGGA